ncbi:DUF4175 family protein [Mucilaginibacter sp. dw_454]|uniref:DUF4175 family protein n=1 Tax=Mucilaginibacter sp. dw_454 TaxID=2720079 RepID=UPI001BD3333B|nr:DUF4175 family protein [Mucilaginibacter sp. dw_454]
MPSAENYNVLIHKINTLIKKYYLNNLLRGLIFLGAGLFSAYVVITVSEYFGNFNSFFRGILFYGFILLNLGLIGWLVIPPILALMQLGKTLTHDEAAAIIAKHFSDINDKLLNTLQLKKLAAEDERHRALIEASIDQRIENLKPVRFPSAINIRENNKYLKWILVPVAVIIVIGLAAPSVLTESTKKIIRHNEYFAPVAPFQFVVLNNTLSAVQGQDLKLDLKLTGNQLPADIYVETAGATFKLDKENVSRFHYQFSNLQQNTTFRLIGNGFTSQPYEIKVNLRPSLLHFDVELKYPAYLHKKNETLANAGDLTIPAGTTVKWLFHTQNASALSFEMNDQLHNLAPASTDLFEHIERVIKPSIYKLNPQNAMVSQSDSASYRINTIADEPPTISVDEKPDSVSHQSFYFNGKIQDDHGFSSLTFHYRIGGPDGKDQIKSVKADLNQSLSDFFYFWNLKDMGIKPGDQVTYFFEVADNNEVTGPQKARTAERSLHVPDANELRDELNAGTTGVKQKMQSAIKLADQIERDSKKMEQTLLDKTSLSFDEKKQVEDLMQKRKDLDDMVKQIQDDNKKNLYNRRENEPQNKELLEEQKQIENLLNNVLDPKTKELLEKLQQLMQDQQKEGTRDELSKMQTDNKSLKKELDRMLELYKKLEFDQKLNQNINQLKKLADKQQTLSDQSKQADQQKTNDPNSQADKDNAERLKQQQENLNKEFDAIKKNLKDLENSENKQDYKNPQDQESQIQNQMQESSDQLSKNNKSKASQSQQNAAKQMQKMAEKMEQDQQDGESKQTEVDVKQLRELLKSLVNSSFGQEKVMESFRTINPSDPNYVTLAQTQKNIKDNLKTAEDSLFSLSKRIPQIQSTVNREITAINTQIDGALDNLGDRRTAEANRNQQYAMTSMNNLALMLADALAQLQNKMNQGGKGGKSKQPSVSQLRQMEEKLSQNMQKMRDQMQKQGGTPMSQSQQGQMSEQLAKMAREQQMIRQSLQQLNNDESKDGGLGVKDADKISRQMEQTEKDIVNRKITDEAIKRQQEIHTRLLEAEKAEQEREQDKQRESNAGKDMPPGYIKALQDYQQAKGKQTEQIKTVPPALNLYYKQKIKSYFDQLNAK